MIPYGSSCRADDELPVFHQLSQTTKQNLAVQTDKFAHMIVYSVHQEQIVFVINDLSVNGARWVSLTALYFCWKKLCMEFGHMRLTDTELSLWSATWNNKHLVYNNNIAFCP